MIPIDNLKDAVHQALIEFRAGVKAFASESGTGVRLGKAVFTFRIRVDGDTVVAQEQVADENEWRTKQVQTEIAGPIERTTNTKTGSYNQAGYTTQQQSGGSSEDVNYEYDPTSE